MPDSTNPSIFSGLTHWWRETRATKGLGSAFRQFAGLVWEFSRDSLPWHRRRRYGDADYDWDHRVDTTGATVGWRDRLLGLLNSPYQPTEPALFHEMLATLGIDFSDFVFIDIGSGKGRTLLMASDYPFHGIIGVELLPALHRAAQANIAKYKSELQRCFAIESRCGDAREFVFPPEPTVLYLFHPLPEAGLVQLIASLEQSLRAHPRTVHVIYHNPVLERVMVNAGWLKKSGGTHQYSIFRS